MKMIKTTPGILLIATERQKQISKHGFTGEHHANHPEWYDNMQLSQAAVALLTPDLKPHDLDTEIPTNWDPERFQSFINRERKERIIIAGALLAAELDRIEYLEK